ncbi:MAG: helix-turn-helix domain-containing protein, partial [Bacteroidia bacterium]|nr:helix-turn-helix domain-containing protein [Bacteroidia bacterium]
WIQRFLIAFLVILFLRILFFALNPEWGQFGSKFWYYICFSVLFYYIAIEGYANAVQSTVILKGNRFVPGHTNISIATEVTEAASSVASSEEDIPDLDIWKPKLEQLMKTVALFRDPELTLTDLAARLDVNSKQLSSIINKGFQVNFNDYINAYRVDAVRQKLDQNEHKSRTLLALALECGFNSKSTFNRAFKKHTGETPRKFIEKLAA